MSSTLVLTCRAELGRYFLLAEQHQISLDFDTLQTYGSLIGSAAVIALGHQEKARDAAFNAMKFF